MRYACVLSLIVIVGCAPYRIPPPQVPTGPGSTDWTAVLALANGDWIFVTMDGGGVRHGYVWRTGYATVTIRDEFGVTAIPRAEIARIAKRVQIGTKRTPWYVETAAAAAFWGGLTGIVIGEKNKNGILKWASMLTATLSLSAGMSAEIPKPIFEDRLVYVRQ